MSGRMARAAALRLVDFDPRPTLTTPEHRVTQARFPAIDAHNHLGRWLSPDHTWTVPEVGAALRVLDACNISAIVNLDGMWGAELEANLDRYDRAYPGRFFTFAQADWDLTRHHDFGARLARQLEDSARRGARGLKVWKTLGLLLCDDRDALLAIDDERLSDLWETAAALDLPVLIHIADPVAFFRPLDRFNERWEELRAHPDWHFYGPAFPSFEALMEQFEHLVALHPRTTFIGAHVGCYAENLGWVGRMMDTYANFNADISARLAELGRQPRAARRFLERYADRIVFGLDAFPPVASAYAPYFRFLETADEHFPYQPAGAPPGQGRWAIYGVDLPDDTLRRIYHETAARLILRDGRRGDPAPADQRETGAG